MQPPQATRRIGLLGGSFNPPHDGHREISLVALDKLGLDAVWWLVTLGNPLKDESDYAPYDERMAAAQRCANHSHIVISDFENRYNLQYTVDTIERLQELNPGVRFVWLMGADSLASFHKWRDWRRIAALAPIAIFNRPGSSDAALYAEAAIALADKRLDPGAAKRLADTTPPAWIFFADTNNPTSSTEIRNQRDAKDAPSS